MRFTLMPQKSCLKNRPLPSTSTVKGLDCIDVGKSGNVYALDTRRVVKKYDGGNDDEVRAEHEVYDRLGPHPNIAEFLGAMEDNSIVLERGQVLRHLLCQQPGANLIPLRTKYRWILHAATGLQHLHDNGIIQSEVGCRNMIVTKGNLKLIDFEGCSMMAQVRLRPMSGSAISRRRPEPLCRPISLHWVVQYTKL